MTVGAGVAAADSVTAGSIASRSQTATLLRLYNPNSGEHFYTESESERDYLASLGWVYEGAGWVGPKKSNTPVYRLYNPNAGDHHYTISEAERDALVSVGWSAEGIGWYSDDDRSVAVHRLYNPNAVAGAHHYTLSALERDDLDDVGWNREDVGWYASASSKVLADEETYPEGVSPVNWMVGERAFVAEWSRRIDAYFEGYPLAGYGQVFAQAAWDYGVDPRWSPVISYTESGKGRKCYRDYNAWGWGRKSWDDWPEAIYAHISGLARSYGYTNTDEAACKYTGYAYSPYETWAEQMAKI